jgi:TolA-binding protein
LGTSYIHLNDKTNARLAYEAALQTNFNPSVREEAMFNYALTCYETTSAFGESIAAFSRFLSEFPNSKYADEAYQYLTSVYLTTKNYELAYQSIQKIKNLNAS